MPKIKVDANVCYRCHHVWLSDLLPGEKPAKLVNFIWVPGERTIPKCCADCKDPNWNRKRQYKMRKGARKPRKSKTAIAEVSGMSGAEIFETVMKTVKPK